MIYELWLNGWPLTYKKKESIMKYSYYWTQNSDMCYVKSKSLSFIKKISINFWNELSNTDMTKDYWISRFKTNPNDKLKIVIREN